MDARGASLRMTALWGVKSIRLATQKTRKDRKSHRLSGGKGGGSIKGGCRTDAFFITLGGPQAHESSDRRHIKNRVSHISRKTSEIWCTRSSMGEKQLKDNVRGSGVS